MICRCEDKEVHDSDCPLGQKNNPRYRGAEVKYHGACEFVREYVTPERKVIEWSLPPKSSDYWHPSPEECCGNHKSVWIKVTEDGTVTKSPFDGEFLICSGCGLDGT